MLKKSLNAYRRQINLFYRVIRKKLEDMYAYRERVTCFQIDIKDDEAVQDIIDTIYQNLTASIFLLTMQALVNLKTLITILTEIFETCLMSILWQPSIFLVWLVKRWQRFSQGILSILLVWRAVSF